MTVFLVMPSPNSAAMAAALLPDFHSLDIVSMRSSVHVRDVPPMRCLAI